MTLRQQTYLFTWSDGEGKTVTVSLVGQHTLSELLETVQAFLISSGFFLNGDLVIEEIG